MKRICKKLLIFLFIFTTFIGRAFASSRLPNGKKPNETLMEHLRGAVRILDVYYGTNEEPEKQEKARNLIVNVLNDARFHDHAVLAFDDIDAENIDDYNREKRRNNQEKINAMRNIIEKSIIVRKEFGL